MIGVLSTCWRGAHEPTESDLRALDVLGRQASYLVGRARAEDAMREREALFRTALENEEALRRSEEQLRASTLAAEIGVWSWTPGTSDVSVTANWRRLFGVAQNAHVDFETWRNALHPDDRDRAVRALNEATAAHREFDTEYRVQLPDGSIRWIVDRGRPWHHGDGRAVTMSGVNIDITERKRAEEDLALVTRLYAVLSRVNEAIVRIREERSLYEEVCRIVADEGGFPLVWVGLVQGRSVVPAASWGRARDYLREIEVKVEGELGQRSDRDLHPRRPSRHQRRLQRQPGDLAVARIEPRDTACARRPRSPCTAAGRSSAR